MSNIFMVFDGYYRDVNAGSLPKSSGVYTVYRCTFNRATGTVSIHQLLYIGQAEDINERIAGHERKADWKRKLQSGEALCYGFSEINSKRDEAEAALIFQHKPPLNTEFVSSYPYESTVLTLSGKIALLENNFAIRSMTSSTASVLRRY